MVCFPSPRLLSTNWIYIGRLRAETNMGTTDDGNDAEPAVRIEEARRRIDRRLEALHRDRSTAIRFVQLNLVVMSLVATGVALGYRTDLEIAVTNYVNRLVVIGVVFLGVSTLLAIVIISHYSRARHRALSRDLPTGTAEVILDHYEAAFDELDDDTQRSSRRVSTVAVLATWALPFLIGGIVVTLFKPGAGCSLPGSVVFTWILPNENPCWLYLVFVLVVLMHLGVTVHHLEYNTELSFRERLP